MSRTLRRLWTFSRCVYYDVSGSLVVDRVVCLQRIADSSKILTNMGLIYATLGEHEAAVERFIEATNLDQYLAVAYVIFDHSAPLSLSISSSGTSSAGCQISCSPAMTLPSKISSRHCSILEETRQCKTARAHFPCPLCSRLTVVMQ
jgi:hypothetical protein